jgi:hypothetical protein
MVSEPLKPERLAERLADHLTNELVKDLRAPRPVVVQRVGLRFLRDPYSNKPNVNFYCYSRVGGGTANTEAVKLIKVATS